MTAPVPQMSAPVSLTSSELTDRELLETILSGVDHLHRRLNVVEETIGLVAVEAGPILDGIKKSPVLKMMGVKFDG